MKKLFLLIALVSFGYTASSQTIVNVRNMSNCTVGYELDVLDANCNVLGTLNGSVNSCSSSSVNIGTQTKYRLRTTFSGPWSNYVSNYSSCPTNACETVGGTCAASSGASFNYAATNWYVVWHQAACATAVSPCY